MNATPKSARMAAYRAQVARDERARVARVASKVRLAYSTSTGDAPRVYTEAFAPVGMDEPDPHCFVCGRHTDHFAEHDDMVEAGYATYGEDGSVFPVPWNNYPDE